MAAEGYQAPGVVVCYTDNEEMHKGRAFAEQSMQNPPGVPLQVGEPDGFRTFRLGIWS